jgi:hypothetical protein
MPFAQIYNMAAAGSERTDRGDFLPARTLSHPNPPPILFAFFLDCRSVCSYITGTRCTSIISARTATVVICTSPSPAYSAALLLKAV